jgi:hypothetical protein
VIALVTAGLLVVLRDRRNRPAPAGAGEEPTGAVAERPVQDVPPPRSPIKMEWIEPPE